MMKTKLIQTAGLLLMATLMVTTVNAQSPRQGCRGSGPNGQGNKQMSAFFSLDLTTEQQEAMKILRTDHYKTMKPLKNKMLELKARERTLMSGESVDMKAVNKVIDEQTGLMNEIRKIQAIHKVGVKEILTDEQEMNLEQRKRAGRNHWDRGPGVCPGNNMERPYHRNGMGPNQRSGQGYYHRNMS